MRSIHCKMAEEDFEIAVKVVIVGNGAVGKSSMIQRYCKGIFTRDYKKTIGVDFLERELEFEGEEVRLMLWDTAGQEEFDAITKAYYRGAQACVIAFSTTDRCSFEAVTSWKLKVENEVGEIPMVLVQNKIDLIDQAQMTESEIAQMAQSMKLNLFRTSVKENLNIDAVFEHLTSRYFSELNSKLIEHSKQASIGPSLSSVRNPLERASARSKQSSLQKLENNEIHEMKSVGRTAKYPHSKDSKRKERCIIS